MDIAWTPKSARPDKLYRVYRPKQYTDFSHRGFLASDRTIALPSTTNFAHFITSVTDHRFGKRRPTPYISAFENLSEAESWAIAAEDVFHQPSYVIEIDMTHKLMHEITAWRVQDIQDKTGKALGGNRDSEWLFLWAVPEPAISKNFKSSTDIRRERGMPSVRYVQNPNTVRRDIPCFDQRLFKGGFSPNPPGLRCGCLSEEKCVHFRWPVKMGADKGKSMKRIEAARGDQVFVGVQPNSPDSGIDMGKEGVRASD